MPRRPKPGFQEQLVRREEVKFILDDPHANSSLRKQAQDYVNGETDEFPKISTTR